jgi:membrane protein
MGSAFRMQQAHGKPMKKSPAQAATSGSIASAKNYMRCLWQAMVNTINHDGVEHAGYLAFLGLLSLFPFLVLLVTFAGILGEQDIGVSFVNLITHNLPKHVVDALLPRVQEIVSGPPQGILTIAILGALWTASSIVEGLRTILNRAYRVHTPPAYALRRLLSIAQLLLVMATVISGMLILVLAPLALNWLEELLGVVLPLQFKAVSALFTIMVMWLAVGSVYYMLPNVKQRYAATLPGALLAVALWVFSGWLLTIYLSQFQQINLIYGSLGGIIASLLFFYMTGLAVIYGAEFNYLLEELDGQPHEEKIKKPKNRLTKGQH